MGDKAAQTHLRLRIAQLAAQLMIESGIRDYAFAKRKAAKQLGVSAARGLPSNEEVDAALVEHLGVPVHTVAGDALAFKITTPLDLQLAAAVLT